MNLRRLNASGVQRFEQYLDLLKSEPTRLAPTSMLADDSFSEEALPQRTIDLTQPPSSRLKLARLLDDLLGPVVPSEVSSDIGLWTWLSLFFWDVVCPADGAGMRTPRERAAYVPEPGNFRRYYRHLLLGPYLILDAHRDDPNRAQALLCKPVHIIDDIVAQIASRAEYVTNPGIVGLTTQLYFDVAKGTTKKGAGGKGGGSPRRLADVLKQLDLTWDLYGMSIVELRQILPKEFDRFLPK